MIYISHLIYIFHVLYIFHKTYRFARDINKIRKDIIDSWARSRKTFRNPTMARLRLTFCSLFSPVWNPRYWNIILTTLLNDNPPQFLVWTQKKGVFPVSPSFPFMRRPAFILLTEACFLFVFSSLGHICVFYLYFLQSILCVFYDVLFMIILHTFSIFEIAG